jgi:glucose-6-phosphate 1-epimerase
MIVETQSPLGLDVVHLFVKDESSGKQSFVEIYTFGAHITRWNESDKPDFLFLSKQSKLDGTKAIRGGIPLVFPQFGGFGPLPQHGFARSLVWKVVNKEFGKDYAAVTLLLEDSDKTRLAPYNWPHKFQLFYTVTLRNAENSTLSVDWKIKNVDSEPFSFTCALHTYFSVGSIHSANVSGLEGIRYLDALKKREEFKEDRSQVAFKEEVDRVYINAPEVIKVEDSHLSRDIVQHKSLSFPDAVVWNPWIVRLILFQSHSAFDFFLSRKNRNLWLILAMKSTIKWFVLKQDVSLQKILACFLLDQNLLWQLHYQSSRDYKRSFLCFQYSFVDLFAVRSTYSPYAGGASFRT